MDSGEEPPAEADRPNVSITSAVSDLSISSLTSDVSTPGAESGDVFAEDVAPLPLRGPRFSRDFR